MVLDAQCYLPRLRARVAICCPFRHQLSDSAQRVLHPRLPRVVGAVQAAMAAVQPAPSQHEAGQGGDVSTGQVVPAPAMEVDSANGKALVKSKVIAPSITVLDIPESSNGGHKSKGKTHCYLVALRVILFMSTLWLYAAKFVLVIM